MYTGSSSSVPQTSHKNKYEKKKEKKLRKVSQTPAWKVSSSEIVSYVCVRDGGVGG